jgi:tRNA(fMet)-specific endonuclease VapC
VSGRSARIGVDRRGQRRADRDAADRAAAVRRALEGRGTSIGMADSLIAGIVLANDGMLLTRNRRNFERVEGLKLATLD